MTTSVKVSEEDKARLEKLQAILTLRSGSKSTQEELLSALIADGLERVDEFSQRMMGATVPISDEEYRRILALVEDWGFETRWEELDKVVYGRGERGRRARASS